MHLTTVSHEAVLSDTIVLSGVIVVRQCMLVYSKCNWNVFYIVGHLGKYCLVYKVTS